MEFTAQQIAQFVQGRVEGDENATVNTFAKIEEGKEGAITESAGYGSASRHRHRRWVFCDC